MYLSGKNPGWFILLQSRDIKNRVLSRKLNNIIHVGVNPIWRGNGPKLSALTAGTKAHPKVTHWNAIWRGNDPKLSASTAGTRAHPKVTLMNAIWRGNEPIGAKLGPGWAKLGPSWAKLGQIGARLGPVGAKLGPSWGQVGPSWAKLGPSWVQVGPKLGPRTHQEPKNKHRPTKKSRIR